MTKLRKKISCFLLSLALVICNFGGVIGPATGNSKPREVLVQFDENSMGEVSE